ncbi:MAG TPA: hypothetical protein VFA75_08020 [Nevskia sp.]|nr:hypothetical protein [Nevskia sp.]
MPRKPPPIKPHPRRESPLGEQCSACTHFIGSAVYGATGRCRAFHQIPADIWAGTFDHRKPHPQDGGITFKPWKTER